MVVNEEIIFSYFPNLTPLQKNRFKQLSELYKDWNSKINVISRKDIDMLYLHHVLHSLSINSFYSFADGSEILDLGTGGGFPGIPLAILLPEVQFTLIDGTSKKLKVVQSVADALELDNVRVKHVRAEESKHHFDMVVTRAVARIDKLVEWSRPLLKRKHQNAYPNGIIALKGGDIGAEFDELPDHEYFEIHPIYDKFPEEYFQEKYVIYLQG